MMLPTPTTLAIQFSLNLTKKLTAEQMESVRRLNKEEKDPDICHSHDFCDANMVMYAAMKAFGVKNVFRQDVTDLWNQAWTIAKAENFYPNLI